MRSFAAVSFPAVILGAIGALCAMWAVVVLVRGEYLSVLVAISFAIFAFSILATRVIVAKGNVTARVDVDDAGTMFRPDGKVDAFLTAATVGAFVAMALYAILTPLDMLDIPVPPGGRPYFETASIAGVLFGLPILWQVLRHGGMSRLRLTPDGFELGTAYSSANRSWDDVSDVSDRPTVARRPGKFGTTYITTHDGRTRPLTSDWYTPGGSALRALVRFYWRNPESRDELTDCRAVERLAQIARG